MKESKKLDEVVFFELVDKLEKTAKPIINAQKKKQEIMDKHDLRVGQYHSGKLKERVYFLYLDQTPFELRSCDKEIKSSINRGLLASKRIREFVEKQMPLKFIVRPKDTAAYRKKSEHRRKVKKKRKVIPKKATEDRRVQAEFYLLLKKYGIQDRL